MKAAESPHKQDESLLENPKMLQTNGVFHYGDTTASTTTTVAEQLYDIDVCPKITQKPKSSINPDGKLLRPVLDTLENLGALSPADNSAKMVKTKVDKLSKAYRFVEKALDKLSESLEKWPKEIDAPEFEKLSEELAQLLRDQQLQFETLRINLDYISLGFKGCIHEEKAKDSTLYKINKLNKNLEQLRKRRNTSEDYTTTQKDLIDADSNLQRQKYRLRQNANSSLRKQFLGYANTLDKTNKLMRDSCELFFTNASQIGWDDNLEGFNNLLLQQHQQRLKMNQNSAKEAFKSPRYHLPINDPVLNINQTHILDLKREVLKQPMLDNSLAHLKLDDLVSSNDLIQEKEIHVEGSSDENNNNEKMMNKIDSQMIKPPDQPGPQHHLDKRGSTMINLSPQKKSQVAANNEKLQQFKRKNNEYIIETSIDPTNLWGKPNE